MEKKNKRKQARRRGIIEQIQQLREHFPANRQVKDRLFRFLFENDREELYKTTLIRLPAPRCVVFYNGSRDTPEEVLLSLSDAFEKGSRSDVEVRVHMLNINLGRNEKLMEKCHLLWEYACFTEEVNRRLRMGLEVRAAINQAVDSCLAQGILTDILEENRMEVIGMLLTECNMHKVKKVWEQEAREG